MYPRIEVVIWFTSIRRKIKTIGPNGAFANSNTSLWLFDSVLVVCAAPEEDPPPPQAVSKRRKADQGWVLLCIHRLSMLGWLVGWLVGWSLIYCTDWTFNTYKKDHN